MKNIHCYDDILKTEYRGPLRHARMSRIARAVQFAPFAALTGYDDAVNERARITDSERILCDDALEQLDRDLAYAQNSGKNVRITYFEPDMTKNGGEYVICEGTVREIDEYERTLYLDNGRKILLDRICEIENNL